MHRLIVQEGLFGAYFPRYANKTKIEGLYQRKLSLRLLSAFLLAFIVGVRSSLPLAPLDPLFMFSL
jgi:hypothetical protein